MSGGRNADRCQPRVCKSERVKPSEGNAKISESINNYMNNKFSVRLWGAHVEGEGKVGIAAAVLIALVVIGVVVFL